MQELIYYLARKYPIIDEHADRCAKYYCCKDLETFSKWSMPKRRSFEWQRAKAVNTICKTFLKADWLRNMEMKELWSTKKIMLFYRKFFFTPPCVVKKQKQDEQQTCSDSDLDLFAVSSVCDVNSFVTNLSTQYPSCSMEYDEEVDIMNVGKPHIKSFKKSTEEACEHDENIILTLPSSSQAEFICDVASEIGVRIKPVQIYPDVNACVVEDMIYKVTKSFAEELIQGAHAAACDLDEKSFVDEIKLRDVVASIMNNSSFSFLSASVGKNIFSTISDFPS
ncbi:YEATS domain-containing protein 2 [Nymphon striatum]|nr:YEATS domain-containing protein 2 [Nymphon striatum]